jgi:hypothetical protein
MLMLILFPIFVMVTVYWVLSLLFSESSSDNYSAHIVEDDLSLIDWISEDI